MNKDTMMTFSSQIKGLFRSVSIKQKLMMIIMSVSLIGLGTVGASILINELINLSKIQKIDLHVMADIVAETTSGFLVFNDALGAAESLAALRAKKQITRAVIFDTSKSTFVVYTRKGGENTASYTRIKKAGTEDNNVFSVWKNIVVDNEVVGYLYLESDDSLIRGFINKAIIGLVFIISIATLIAYLLASRLQKIISEPIEHLTQTASKITAEQNYSLRAEKESEDEIGVLTDEFNKMLAQLEIRNEELLESENKFREVVEQSVDALFIVDEEGGLIDVNNAACRSLGYDRDELLKLKVEDIDTSYRNRDKIRQHIRRLNAEQHITVESEHLRKDGQVIPVEVRLGFVNIEGHKVILASVRDMTERKYAQEKLQQAYDLLEAKVNERTHELKEANQALSIAKEKAEAANRAKTLFLANMSHEIRTPMNAVIGFTDVLSSSGLNEKQLGYVKSIQSGSRNLLSLINDILDLSKIEAGKLKIQLSEVHIRQLLEDIRQVFSISAKQKGLDLQLEIHDEVPETIMSDELRLRQILFNLVNNAIKFTNTGSVRITLEYEFTSTDDIFASLVFKVIDTGIGIAEDDYKTIFNTFEQQDNQNTREFGGAGLGLAISSRLAEKLNADLSVESEIGKGSCFQLVLHSPEVVDRGIDKSEVIPAAEYNFSSATILVVDDVDVNRELISEFLSDQPFRILQAENGKQAIESIKKNRPDVVLMDIRMPVMNGIEATQHIKKDPEISDIPIVAITASVVEDKKADKKRSLFDYVLYKPLNRKALNLKLSEILEAAPIENDMAETVDFLTAFEQEVKGVGVEFYEKIREYKPILERAKTRGSFGGLDQLLDELNELSVEFDLREFRNMIARLKEANHLFDIEETQALLAGIISGIQILQEKYDDQAF